MDNVQDQNIADVADQETNMEIVAADSQPVEEGIDDYPAEAVPEIDFTVDVSVLEFSGYKSAYNTEQIVATTLKNYDNWRTSEGDYMLDLAGYLPTEFNGLRTANMPLLRESTYLIVVDVVGGPSVLSNQEYVKELRRGILRTGSFFVQYSGDRWDENLNIETDGGALRLYEVFRVSIGTEFHIAQYAIMSGDGNEYAFANNAMWDVALRSVHSVFGSSHHTLAMTQSHVEPILRFLTARRSKVLWFFMLPAFVFTFLYTRVSVAGQHANYGLWAVDSALNADRITMTSSRSQVDEACKMFVSYYQAHDTDSDKSDATEYVARGLALTLRSIVSRLARSLPASHQKPKQR